ncbi:Tf2-11, partial [Mucuna pruriens]
MRSKVSKCDNKLLFSTIALPQTNRQTEVVNRTLATLLRVIIQENLKIWEKCLPEFAYNRIVHSTTSYSPFEVVYGFNPLTLLYILTLPTNEHDNLDGKHDEDFKGFLLKKYKLQLRGDEPFQVLERINDDGYKLDLPTTYGEEFDLRMNPFEKGGNDRDPTKKAKDSLYDIGGSMT